MKVIDLLNKIANGKEVPKKIKWKDREYKYVNEYKDYSYDNAYCFFEDDLLKTRKLLKCLNDEVDIIQDNKIELDLYTNARCGKRMTTEEQDYNWELISKNFEIINKKLNEVLNEKDN